MKAIAISACVLMLALAVSGQEPSLVITNATVINLNREIGLQGARLSSPARASQRLRQHPTRAGRKARRSSTERDGSSCRD
jgi:hypothetical protein